VWEETGVPGGNPQGAMQRPRYNGVRVIMELQCNAFFLIFSIPCYEKD